MPLTSAQLKGRIKSLASKNNANARKIISAIIDIDLGDEMTFSIKAVENIMDEMEYPGIRVLLDSQMEKMMIPLKIDISTGA